MRIFITGFPGVGKSTIIEKVRQSIPESIGILAREYRKGNDRIGFIAENWVGESKLFMHKVDQPSTNCIGQPGHWYEVDVSVIDTFIVPELQRAAHAEGKVLYIDEIGRAQMKSAAFINLVRTLLLKSQKSILATIVRSDDPGSPSLEFKRYSHVCLLEVTQKNREVLPRILIAAFKNADLFKKLDSQRQLNVFNLLKKFINNGHYVSAEKIFTHALDYFISNKLILLEEKDSVNQYLVRGRAREHKVDYHRHTQAMTCDCDLSTGMGCYNGFPETCSHQIVILLSNSLSAPVRGLFEPKQNDKLEKPDYLPSASSCRSRL
jgi:nucleoside-triphosphatase